MPQETTEKKVEDQGKKKPWYMRMMSAKDRCNNPNNRRYDRYGGRGIMMLLTPDDFEFLWERDLANKMRKPSIDRINNDGHYERSNCRFIEQKENSGRSLRKPVAQYDLSGNLIKKWNSTREITRTLGIDSSSLSNTLNCKKHRKTCGGFIWKYI